MNRYNCIKLDRARHTGGRIAFLKKSSLRYQKRKTNDNGTSQINDLELNYQINMFYSLISTISGIINETSKKTENSFLEI